MPKTDTAGNPITYKEYDIHPYQKGVNRRPERVVIGSDGSVWYTPDHYTTFVRVRWTVRLADLFAATPPWIVRYEGSPRSANELTWRLNADGACAKVVRGKKMRNVPRLFDELGAALQFPDYFGENWAALEECVCDLAWMSASAYVIVVVDSSLVLTDEPPGDLITLRDILIRAATKWSKPIAEGQDWDRPPIPFHVILQTMPEDSDQLRDTWETGDDELSVLA